jgi:hypothetical protein
MHRSIKILIAIAILILLGYGFNRVRAPAANTVSSTPATSSIPLPTATSGTTATHPDDSLKTYRNSDFGFEFSFPTMGGSSVELSDATESMRYTAVPHKPYLLFLNFCTPPRCLFTQLTAEASSVQDVAQLMYDYDEVPAATSSLVVATSTIRVNGIPALFADVTYPEYSGYPGYSLGHHIYIHVIHRGNLLTWRTLVDDSFSKELTEAFRESLKLF